MKAYNYLSLKIYIMMITIQNFSVYVKQSICFFGIPKKMGFPIVWVHNLSFMWKFAFENH